VAQCWSAQQQAASRAIREMAAWRAPAVSKAPVASASSRPVSPRLERTETEACTWLPRAVGGEVVRHIQSDRAVRAQRQSTMIGLVDLDVEANAASGEAPGDPRTGAREQALADELVDVERHRGPASDCARICQHVEHVLGTRLDGRGGRPCPHDRRHSHLPTSAAMRLPGVPPAANRRAARGLAAVPHRIVHRRRSSD
jgi:hypothetical protein